MSNPKCPACHAPMVGGGAENIARGMAPAWDPRDPR